MRLLGSSGMARPRSVATHARLARLKGKDKVKVALIVLALPWVNEGGSKSARRPDEQPSRWRVQFLCSPHH